MLVTYKDGTRGTAMTVGSGGDRWNFACRLKGQAEPLATAFYSGPWGNWNLFCALSGAIAQFFRQMNPNDMPVGGTATAKALERARELLARRYSTFGPAADLRERRRVMNFLQRRGFAPATVWQVRNRTEAATFGKSG